MTRNNTTENTDDNTKESESLGSGGQYRRKQNQKALKLNFGSTTYDIHNLWQVT